MNHAKIRKIFFQMPLKIFYVCYDIIVGIQNIRSDFLFLAHSELFNYEVSIEIYSKKTRPRLPRTGSGGVVQLNRTFNTYSRGVIKNFEQCYFAEKALTFFRCDLSKFYNYEKFHE